MSARLEISIDGNVVFTASPLVFLMGEAMRQGVMYGGLQRGAVIKTTLTAEGGECFAVSETFCPEELEG